MVKTARAAVGSVGLGHHPNPLERRATNRPTEGNLLVVGVHQPEACVPARAPAMRTWKSHSNWNSRADGQAAENNGVPGLKI